MIEMPNPVFIATRLNSNEEEEVISAYSTSSSHLRRMFDELEWMEKATKLENLHKLYRCRRGLWHTHKKGEDFDFWHGVFAKEVPEVVRISALLLTE